nr:immunoglobulin light chain junction region [Macaca mulatta]MOX18992.1 immunoglobulin light chain junction region [Macaca mulatta]MOX22856.1 immunoglobulin light chain junction region [Macaca mulatta]
DYYCASWHSSLSSSIF